MKTYISIISILLSLLLILSSCNLKNNSSTESSTVNNYIDHTLEYYTGEVTSSNITSLIADFTSNESLAFEIDYWTGIPFFKEDMADKFCNAHGKSYTGSYSYSEIDRWNSYIEDNYLTEKYIEFGFRNDTGKLVYLNLMNSDFFITEPYLNDIDNHYETAVSIAKDIAKEYVDDISDYTQIIQKPNNSDKIPCYTIKFTRKINGYDSSDYINIRITCNGNLASIKVGDINAFKDVTFHIDSADINESISNKISSIYGSSLLNFNIKDQKIVKTPDGNFGLYSNVIIDKLDNSNVKTQAGICILTVLEKST